jgi:hypothetical protein
MVDIQSRLKGVTDKRTWAARGASFMAKLKATKAVWFPPEPVKSGKKTVAAAKKTTRKTTRKTTGAAKKATSAAKS